MAWEQNQEEWSDSPAKRRRLNPPETGPYVLRTLLDNVPVETDGYDDDNDVHITTVEYWNENLYIGTSAAEILHFVSLPPDPSDQSTDPTFILASRLPLTASAITANSLASATGVQQILLLPEVNKTCILCNGVVTFYSLPELSPAFGAKQVANCKWIGGVDLDGGDEISRYGGQMIMVAVPSRVMLLRIGDELARVKNIGFPGCVASARRDTIACVADMHSYSLLEVEHQQKIPLFPISSLEEATTHEVEQMSSRPSSMVFPPSVSAGDGPGHGRSTSLGAFVEGFARRQPSPGGSAQRRTGTESPETLSRSGTPAQGDARHSTNKPLPLPPDFPPRNSSRSPAPEARIRLALKPHIASPTPTEYLLTTGTGMSEPGVGMFVNTDGDVVRGTLEFERYPEALIVDGVRSEGDNEGDQEGYIFAIMSREDGDDQKWLEIQRWDVEPGENHVKNWIQVPTLEDEPRLNVGIVSTKSETELRFGEVGTLLRSVRLQIPGGLSGEVDGEAKRLKEEEQFVLNLGAIQTNLTLWSGNRIWRIMQNPQILQLENALQSAVAGDEETFNRVKVLDVIKQIRNAEPKTETDFLGTIYIRQKASLLLFKDLLDNDASEHRSEAAYRTTQDALVNGGLDPRVILLLIPSLKDEVLEGTQGIWLHQGLASLASSYLSTQSTTDTTSDHLLFMMKQYLSAWQQRKGYASIADEQHIFESVDAALLHLLLELDQQSPNSVRNELNALVDKWKGNFDRAVSLLERYQRLFLLSRLYQSRKISGEVLKSWRRIVDGETDAGHEMSIAAVESRVRNYLVKIRDSHLVQEYGTWLAGRNPKLGVQVFADDTSRVKFEPQQVVEILKQSAPNAVQEYLEHLVFGKNYTHYADDLIGYYLDTVLTILEESPEARTALATTYDTYRALQPPKPTYLNFITENAPPEPWWQSRLRLLQLLSGSGNNFNNRDNNDDLPFSIPTVLTRLEPHKHALISESIILDGRQGRHKEALHLLVQGLGDYDTAIRYCLFGGIGPISGSTAGGIRSGPIALTLPPRAQQEDLFAALLREFLAIPDLNLRLTHTSSLLAKFHSYFPVQDVLPLVPDHWSVEVLAEYLVRVLRDLKSEGREARVVRALAAGENLGVAAKWVGTMKEKGGFVLVSEEQNGNCEGEGENGVGGVDGQGDDFS